MKEKLREIRQMLEAMPDPMFALDMLNVYERFYMDGWQDGYQDAMDSMKKMREVKKFVE